MLTRLPLPITPPVPRNLLALPGRLLPGAFHSRSLALILNRMLTEAINDGQLDFLADRVLQIEVTDLALDYRLTLSKGKLAAASGYRPADVRFGGQAREFLLLALGHEDPDTLFFQRRLQLEGDTELGLEIKNLLYSLESGLLPAPMEGLASHLLKLLPA